jgi:hypothetical protein
LENLVFRSEWNRFRLAARHFALECGSSGWNRLAAGRKKEFPRVETSSSSGEIADLPDDQGFSKAHREGGTMSNLVSTI